MIKVNASPLECIGHGCTNIPTIVLEFVDPSGMRVKGQIIACNEHRQEGITRGNEMFGRNNLSERKYPYWLLKLQEGALNNGIIEGKPVVPEVAERLRVFMSGNRGSVEKR